MRKWYCRKLLQRPTVITRQSSAAIDNKLKNTIPSTNVWSDVLKTDISDHFTENLLI